MKKLVKIFFVVTVVAAMMGIVASSAMANVPKPGIDTSASMKVPVETVHLDSEEGSANTPDIYAIADSCAVSGLCNLVPVGNSGNTAGTETPGELVPVAPDEPSTNDVPSQNTEIIPEQPELTTTEVTPPPSSSQLPNTGSGLLLVAAIGTVLAAGALGARMLVARRAK